MPYTSKQHKAFEAVAHGWKPSSKKSGLAHLSKEKAAEMASEGIKKESPVSTALKKVTKK